MRVSSRLAAAAVLAVVAAGRVEAAPFAAPAPAPADAHAAFGHATPAALRPRDHGAASAAMARGALDTLPYWQTSFVLDGRRYPLTTLGTPPDQGGRTVIDTVLVPLRLIIAGYSADGVHPLVLDAGRIVGDVAASPIFRGADYGVAQGQFADAMLHVTYPQAKADWHVLFAARIAPTLTVVIPKGDATVYRSVTGALYAVLTGPRVTAAMQAWLFSHFSPHLYPVFLSYNSLTGGAFGFHSYYYRPESQAATVYSYNSWIVNVPELQSPDAATLSHEVAETVQDALGPDGTVSLTKEWGDAFNANKCFQPFIEVGDAVEDAPFDVWASKVRVTVGGVAETYTVQTEALVPWFERLAASPAVNGAYSFPNAGALTSAAPLMCSP